MSLVDSYQRRFRYLRLSVTDSCNFRCVYCLPNGNCIDPKQERPLDLKEIENLILGFRELGVEKVRITGGEPTLRRDIVDIFALLRDLGIPELALSTNAYRLESLVPRLYDAGCRSVNVSLDSLNPERFALSTGQRSHSEIMRGIDAALGAGMKVKVNAVLMKGVNDDELPRFLDYIRAKDLSLRFIELMQTGDNHELFRQRHLRATPLIMELETLGFQRLQREILAGPAMEYAHPEYRGRIGFITPYASGFCDSCNRLRVSCRGELKLCLFGDGQSSLRHLLQDREQRVELKAEVLNLLTQKKATHALLEGRVGNTKHLASIGG